MSNNLKIVVVGKKNVLHWDEYVRDAFKALGHDVYHVQINNRPPLVKFCRGVLKLTLGKKRGNRLADKIHVKIISSSLKDINPDLCFYTSACFIPEDFYTIASKCQVKQKILAWECDGGATDLNNKYLSKYVDILFDTENEFVKQNPLGCKRVINLAFCANTNIYKDLKQKRKNSFYFCGALSEERCQIFSQLLDFNIVFKGCNKDRLAVKGDGFDISSESVCPEEQAADYNAYLGVINIHQLSNNPISALNMRAFEAPASKALLISDYRDGIEQYFEIGKEILCYRNADELKTILQQITQDPDAYDSIRDAGYKRVLKDHTYVSRMAEALSYI